METVSDFIEAIDLRIEPKHMSLKEAIDFCERLVMELENKIEGMKEDLLNL